MTDPAAEPSLAATSRATTAPVAVVMASSRGLGRGAAEILAASGHTVSLCGRDRSALDEAVRSLLAAGAEAEGVVVDVSDPAATEAFVSHSIERFGRLDVLVANAGGPPPGDFADLTVDDWQRAHDITLMSAVTAIRTAIPQMRKQKRGRLIVIGSSSVRIPLAGLTLSNVYRPALDGLVKSLAVELGDSGITVNMVCPGKIDTDRVRGLDEMRAQRNSRTYEEQRAATESEIPMRRYGHPHDVGAAIGFLASDAAGYITGQSLLVDGGLVPALP